MSSFFSDEFQDYDYGRNDIYREANEIQLDFGSNCIENFDMDNKLMENVMMTPSGFIEAISTPTTIGSSELHPRKILFQTKVCSSSEIENSNAQSGPSHYEVVSNLELKDNSELESPYLKSDSDYLLKKRGKEGCNSKLISIYLIRSRS